MKLFFYLSLFLLLFHSLNLKLEEDIETITLKDEKEVRIFHTILTNLTYKIISANEKRIFFIELPEGLQALDTDNQTLKGLVALSLKDNYFIINQTKVIGIEKNISVVSIANEGISISSIKGQNLCASIAISSNIIFLLYGQETEDQVIRFNSFENSILFSYWKYQYSEDINPINIYPVNRSLFQRYDGDLFTLEKDSVYIFVVELYKLDSTMNNLEFLISPLQQKHEINLEYDALYLNASENDYSISFKEKSMIRVLKLSKKTNESVIIIDDGKGILNSMNPYYELTEDQIKNGIKLKVSKADCFIEVLYSSENDTDILDYYSQKKYKLTKTYNIIKIPKNKCKYDFTISSENKNKLTRLYFGLNHKISKNGYFYSWNNISTSYRASTGASLTINSPYLYRTEMYENESQIFELVLDKQQLDNDIYLTYGPKSFYEHLQKEIDENTSDYIIGNISEIFRKYYIYKDIAKKPPTFDNLKNYHHEPIDIVESLNGISGKNKTYLNLYQDITQTIYSLRDWHVKVLLSIVDKNYGITSASYCIPFELYIGNNSNVPVVKIKVFPDCLNFSPKKDSISKFIDDHNDIPLESINGTDPFEFIQNFGGIQFIRSRHAQFNINIQFAKTSRFQYIPFDLSDILDIEYKFENGDIINLDYLLIGGASFKDINQEEFNEFQKSLYVNTINGFLVPNIFEARKLFLKKKGLLFEETPDKIAWDYQTKEGGLKCKVDNISEYNVFLQKTFLFSDIEDALDIMVKCSELFYSNDYKIIGIEDNNGGGRAFLYEVWHQLIQQKTLDKTFRSLLSNEDSKQYFENVKLYTSFVDAETCKYYGSLELGETMDNYGKSDIFHEEIKHNRTSKLFDFIDKNWRKKLEVVRKKISKIKD